MRRKLILNQAVEDPPRVVLDTNTVLAWFWFRDMNVSALGAAVESRRVSWLATLAMRHELEAVLRRGLPGSRVATLDSVIQAFDQHAGLASDSALVHRLMCTDRSDQMFIDLAVGHRVRWLFSRDRAVLKLRRRALNCGVEIVRPDGWVWPETARKDA